VRASHARRHYRSLFARPPAKRPIEVKSGASGRLRSLHVFVREKSVALGVRVSSAPLSLDEVQTTIPGGQKRRFRLLSVPFYLAGELPRLIGEAA